MSERVRRVEHDPGWGWIARRKDGGEVLHDFRWYSRDVALSVARAADRKQCPAPPPAMDGEASGIQKERG